MTDVHHPEFDIHGATQEVAALLGAVREDQLTHSTPCERYSVAALLDHLMGLCAAFTGAARKSPAARGRSGRRGPDSPPPIISTPRGAMCCRAGSRTWPRHGRSRRRGRA